MEIFGIGKKKKKKYGKISVKVLPTGGRLPNKRSTKHIHIQQFSMKFLLRSLYAHNSLLYFHTHIGKCTNMPYSVDSITFKFEDKKTAKRTAIFATAQQLVRSKCFSLYVPIIR